MNDPTLSEMQTLLYTNAGEQGMEGTNPDLESAIYWYASDYHSGQASNLYSAVNQSPYQPGPIESGDESRDSVWYCILEGEYK